MKWLRLSVKLAPEAYTATFGMIIMIIGGVYVIFPLYIIGVAVGLPSWIIGTYRHNVGA